MMIKMQASVCSLCYTSVEGGILICLLDQKCMQDAEIIKLIMDQQI